MKDRVALKSGRSSSSLRILLLALLTFAVSGAWASTPNIDLLDELLLQNVRNGFVDYDGLAADERFAIVVREFGSATPDIAEASDAGLSFYINAYNVLAIDGILSGYSPDSWWGRRKFFRGENFELLGEEVTLDAIEHDRIAAFGDPRIHFAIVCASISCPRLSSRAYQPDSINVQLHDAARRFINDPSRNRFDAERRIAFVSMIFDWYSEDFEKAAGSVQRYIARFIDDAEVQEALRADEFELRYEDYDWNLNGHYSDADR